MVYFANRKSNLLIFLIVHHLFNKLVGLISTFGANQLFQTKLIIMKLSIIQKFMAAFIIVFLCCFTAQSQAVTKSTTEKASLSESSRSVRTTSISAEQNTMKAEKQVQSAPKKDCNNAKPSEKDCAKSKVKSSSCCDQKKVTASGKECQDKKKAPASSGDKK
jgi:hypothetical protein